MSLTVSSTSTASTLLSASSSSSTSLASLESQLAAKEKALSEAETEDDKTGIQEEIDALEAKIAAAKLEQSKSSSGASQAATSENDSGKETATFSGESSRIGTVNFDENTPVGERVAYF
jgi:peptidoglycan hydrolase CwlO-like protein